MEKKYRKAVRTFLIKNNKVVAIIYKSHDQGFYDIPGGKIEEKESAEETSIREFKEETGVTITKQHHAGHFIIEYPDRIYDMDVFVVDDFLGNPLEFEENKAVWIDINDLLNETKIFPSIEVIKHLKDDMELKIECDSNHKILKLA